MRISTTQFQLTSLNTILHQQAKLSKLQEQLGTGKRIVSPSDDPAGAAQALELAAKVAGLEQLKKNGDLAQHRLAVEEGVLDDLGRNLQRVRDLMLQANNDSNSASERRLIATELKEILNGMVQLANADDGNGEYLFGGTASRSEPFAVVGGAVHYLGDQAERLVQVGPSRQLAVNHNGFDVFMKIPQGNGDFVVRPGAGNQGTGVVQTGRLIGGGVPAYDYAIEFSADGSQYQVNGGAWNDFAAGEPIEIDGALQITITGAPAGGDRFTVSESTSQSVFAMVGELEALLAGAEEGQAWRTGMHNAVNRLLGGIDQAQTHILNKRAEVGARGSAIDAEARAADNAILELETARSKLEDLDYASAISQFQLRLTGLQAAQQSYMSIQGLSLFNFL